MNRQSIEWEETVTNHLSYKELISKMYKEFLELNIKEPKNAIKNGQKI